MSNYDDASLIMFPSGYKEDKIYSLKPTDGSGDLTFTRASTATRVNADGLIEVCPWNMVGYSEEFNNAYWNKTGGASVTANDTTAPNGTLTADKISFSAYAHELFNNAQYNITGVYTHTFYAKGTAGQIVNYYDGFGDTAITLTADWVRYTVTRTYSNQTLIMNFNSYGSWTASNFFLWGAQVNIGATAKTYFPTTDRLNVPRIDYTGGGCGKLLLESQRTNLVTYSEQFDNAAWSKEASTSTANQTTSPDGTQNADTFIDDSVNSRHIFYQQFNGNLATSRTFSLYAKQNSLRYLFMSVTNTGDSHCYSAIFDLQSGTVSATKVNGDATISASIVSAGNGWYRCIISGTMTTGTANYFPLIGTSNRAEFTGSLYANNTPEYSGSGQSIYLWGAQLEAGSYSSSYIPTLASSVTRLADAAFKTGISSLIGQTEGTMFLDFDFTNSGTQVLFTIHDSSNNKRIEFWANSAVLNAFIGGSVNITIGTSSITNGRHKAALAYKQSGDHAFYIDGVQIGTSATAYTIAALTALRFDYWNGGFLTGTKIGQAIVFPTRLTNAELATLTTI